MFAPMKRFSFLLVALTLFTAPALRAQPAATEERLNKLNGRIDDLSDRLEALRADLQKLSRAMDDLRAEASKPKGDYASQEDLKRVAEAVKEVDRKRLDDAETIRKELRDLAKGLKAAPVSGGKRSNPAVAATDPSEPLKSGGSDKGFEYVIKSGDTLSVIVAAYREKNIKVSTEQILKANPNLVPEKMRPGQKIFIPAPQ
jgi:septal ring factor EnvC (AmiA/AmiB activator)